MLGPPCPTRKSGSVRSAGPSPPSTSCASSRRPTPPREPGAVVGLLHREGLYSSHLVEWRRLYRLGALHNLAHPRGRPPGNPLSVENERLRHRVARLEARLATAERIIVIQGKVSELLGIPLAQSSDDEPSGS